MATKSKRSATTRADEARGENEAQEQVGQDHAHAGHAHPRGVRVSGRKAHGVDPAVRERNLARLRRIEGQVRGLQKMVEADRYCADILTQMSSVHEALRAVGRELVRNHLKHCATAAINTGEAEAEDMYDELVDMMYKHVR